MLGTLPEERAILRKKKQENKVTKKVRSKPKVKAQPVAKQVAGSSMSKSYESFIEGFTARTEVVAKERGIKITSKIKYVNNLVAAHTKPNGAIDFIFLGDQTKCTQ